MNPSSEDNSTIERDSKKVPVVGLYHHNIGNDLCQVSFRDSFVPVQDCREDFVILLYQYNIGNYYISCIFNKSQNTSILLVPETNEQDSAMLIEPCETVEKSMNKVIFSTKEFYFAFQCELRC